MFDLQWNSKKRLLKTTGDEDGGSNEARKTQCATCRNCVGGRTVSLQYLKEAVANNDNEKLIRYVRLHLGDWK